MRLAKLLLGVGATLGLVAYLRAEIGRSTPGPEPRSAEQIAHELHALLATLQIAPPYVLVGHSAGGFYVRVFAHLYPQEVAGLILVDASWPLPAVPTVVLSSTKPQGEWPLETPDDVAALAVSQTQLAERIAGSKHIVVADTDHLSILWSSTLSEQIQSVVKKARPRNNR